MLNYQVEEYTELDFEHVVLETPAPAYCDSCNTTHEDIHAGVWQCQYCGTINHKDLEV